MPSLSIHLRERGWRYIHWRPSRQDSRVSPPRNWQCETMIILGLETSRAMDDPCQEVLKALSIDLTDNHNNTHSAAKEEEEDPIAAFRRDNNTQPRSIAELPLLPLLSTASIGGDIGHIRQTSSLEDHRLANNEGRQDDSWAIEANCTALSDPTTVLEREDDRIQRILTDAMIESGAKSMDKPIDQVVELAKSILKAKRLTREQLLQQTPSTMSVDDAKKAESAATDDNDLEEATESDDGEPCLSESLSEDCRELFLKPSDLTTEENTNGIEILPCRERGNDEIEEHRGQFSPVRRAHFADTKDGETDEDDDEDDNDDSDSGERLSLSMTESEVESVSGLPDHLQNKWLQGEIQQEQILQRLDGVDGFEHSDRSGNSGTISSTPQVHNHWDEKKADEPEHEPAPTFFDAWPLNYLWGGWSSDEREDHKNSQRHSWRHDDDTLALLGCAQDYIRKEERKPAVATSLVRVTSEPGPPSYAETINASHVDPRMQDWIDTQYNPQIKPPKDGSYYLGSSRTVVVHEIVRGSWTWCTEWSPNGDLLAVASENHHLAIIDTTSSTVWRVRHDERIKGPVKNHTTHSIRSIAWGAFFIAIGGTGNAVSILAPTEPYPVLHTIKGTGFVGSLSWRSDSTVVAIGSRLNKALIARIRTKDDCATAADLVAGNERSLQGEILHTIECKNWVNRVAFSPGGTCLAVGDAGGTVSVYKYEDEPRRPSELTFIKNFTLEDSCLDIEWSPDGKWLYAGGEDFNVTVIDTNHWEIVHRINRERWVQCVAASNGGSHLAVGGVRSEITILDVKNGWDSVLGIELKGLVPLSAKWHPKDQYLTVTGQNNSILAVETTNARHVKGHHLQSITPILAVEFSPDGRMAVIGNESGVVTFFSLSGSTFVTAYELIVTLNDRVSIEWSVNGVFACIGSKDALIVVQQRSRKEKHDKRKGRRLPPNACGFSVRKVVRNVGEVNAVAIDSQSHYIAVTGIRTYILDATLDFKCVLEFKNGPCHANAWSPDGRWLATIGQNKILTIYDTSSERVDRWRPIFSLRCDFVGLSLAWGPLIVGGLLYLAYGGDGSVITIMEIRAMEGTWETVLRIPRDGPIRDLDWNTDGLLAAAIGNGTVTIVDLAYLQSGVAVNEMDYNWQRQALTCFTEIRRNRGINSMRSVRWIPSAPGSDSLLAIGGTDGELEIVDLTERDRCNGYSNKICK